MAANTASFRRLPDLDIGEGEWDQPLPLFGEAAGTFANGLQFYVATCSRPADRAALALAVRVGSVLEEETERGVAHIVEHLAFNATEKYQSHQIVQLLEELGLDFGACSNAYTSADETVYELMVPLDKPEVLEKTLDVLAQFATAIRCAPEDLHKERGAVLEEWRMGRSWAGRVQEAHWKLLMQGSKYAERQPIGLESVIKGVPDTLVRAFYQRWYRPENMAVVAVGNFPDVEAVVATLRRHFEVPGPARSTAVPIPRFDLVPHDEPRVEAFTDKEVQQSSVYVSFKHPAPRLCTPADYQAHLCAAMFHNALNQRLFRMSRQTDPPFYSAQVASEPVCKSVEIHAFSASAAEGKTLEALEAVLVELARVRLHGFTEREIRAAAQVQMAENESLFTERDQEYSDSRRAEYVRHFTTGEMVIGPVLEARLAKTLLPRIQAAEVARLADACCLSSNCVIKSTSHRRGVGADELLAVALRVREREAAGAIPPLQQDALPGAVIEGTGAPAPGTIVARRSHARFGASELTLSNGMRITYKVTDHADDQILVTGWAPGGLSEVPRTAFRSAAMAQMLADELGPYGFKPEVLEEMLMGKRVDVATMEGSYWRGFGGEQSPSDLETALQLICRLFTTRVQRVPAELATCLRHAQEQVRAQLRDPSFRFTNTVNQVVYGNCYFYEPFTLRDLYGVDPKLACSHFSDAFCNPAEFHIALTGAIEVEVLEDLAVRYLASIPAVQQPAPRDRSAVTPLPFSFPERPRVLTVRAAMVEPTAQVMLALPVRIALDAACLEETRWLNFCCQLLTTRLTRVLRFQSGKVYAASAFASFGTTAPSEREALRGEVRIGFSCDPVAGNAAQLAELALAEVERLQEEGPSEEEAVALLTLEQRAQETAVQENSYWHDRALTYYKSRLFQGDLDDVHASHEAAREAAPLAARMLGALSALAPSREQPARYWVGLAAAAAVVLAASVGVARMRRL
ncbi:hypothetical protein WJX81_003803 [Elliptochloris bilobata]|uniref:Chloroplast processing enzyme n=1 Tax=Elliptochloris bilobata TaxID=381761 RepID=A0AAW1SLK2_9CHLO